MKNLNDLKDRAVLLGWIAGLLIIISIIWFFSQPLQTHYLLRTVNSVLINNKDSRRVTGYLPVKSGQTGLLGFWYYMQNSSDLFFVFTVFHDGILVPLGAIVSANGSIEEIIPLSAHAVQIYDKIHDSVLQIYVRRIETTAKAVIEG
jgi:hypothetical protein